MLTKGWCVFWIIFCAAFLVWDVVFMIINAGSWWFLFFAACAAGQFTCGRSWAIRYMQLHERSKV